MPRHKSSCGVDRVECYAMLVKKEVSNGRALLPFFISVDLSLKAPI